MNIEELKKEYSVQDNRFTAYPIYVQVQELICIGVMAIGYSPICPYGDSYTKMEHNCDNCSKYPCWNDDEKEPEHCLEDEPFGYIWHPVEFFLTVKGAEEYIKADKHNHGELRTYVCHFDRRNFEMRGLLEELGFKTK